MVLFLMDEKGGSEQGNKKLKDNVLSRGVG